MKKVKRSVGLVKHYSVDVLKGLWGIRHLLAVLYYLLHPIYSFFYSIYRGLKALLLYQGDFLAIFIFVLTALLGNLYGI